MNLTVEEQPTGEVSLGAGVGTDGGVLGGGLTEKNFLKKDINLDSDFQISDDGIKGSLTYSKPNFNYTDNTLFTSIKSTTQDSLSNYGYKITTAGLSVGTSFEQYNGLFFPWVGFYARRFNDLLNCNQFFKKQEGAYSDFYFNYGLSYDTRNNVFNPTDGSIFFLIKKFL